MSVFEVSNIPIMALNFLDRKGAKGFYHRVGKEWVNYSPDYIKNSIYLLSLALKEIGVGKGVGVGIIAPSSPKWFMMDIAVQICGGYIVPLFSNISSWHFEFQIEDSQAKVLVIDTWKALSEPIAEQSLSIPRLIHFAPLPDNVKHPNSSAWEDFIEKGRRVDCEQSQIWYKERLNEISPEDVFSVLYTSGSTGMPKGVPLTHKNMLVQLDSIWEKFPLDPDKNVCMSVLPIAHIFERMAVYYFSGVGLPVYFADNPGALGKYLPEVRPSCMIVVPRILEKLYESLIGAAKNKPVPAKWLLNIAINKAKINDPEKKSLRGTIWDKLVYSKMRAALGDNFKMIVSGSSALNIQVNRFMRNIGLPLFEGYGMTECSPVISTESFLGREKMGSVGLPLKCITAKIGEGSEILVKGGCVFNGYLHHPELNGEIFTKDGFFRTGDKGYIDDNGYIWITGRIKEMFKTSTGKYVSPIPIEQALCRRAFIEAAQVFADDRKFATAIIFLNKELVAKKLKKNVDEFNIEIASNSKHLNAEIKKHVELVNKNLSEWERITRWVAVFDSPSVENGLLTPTLKLRRAEIEKKYSHLIDGMYNSH